MALKRQGEKTIPDFIEDDFISALETGLNRTFYYKDKFIEISRISQTDENELGYDGVLTTLVPFYLQFKRSDFYSPQFTGELMKNRKAVNLPVKNGFYAFELLKKEKKYAQHNTMFHLSRIAKAAYVAPMFYKKSYLSKLKSYSNSFIPSYYDDVRIIDYHFNRGFIFHNVRLFKNTITIPPHILISDNNPSHHYSYSRDYKIGFHSKPHNLENNKSQNLYFFLKDIFEQKKAEKIENISDMLFNQIPQFFGLKGNSTEFFEIIKTSIKRISIIDDKSDYNSIIKDLNFFDKLLIMEDILFQYFGIRQFVKYERIE